MSRSLSYIPRDAAVCLQPMRICICEFPDEEARKEGAWKALVQHATSTTPDLVVLPEMPFCQWIFTGDHVDASQWQDALRGHEASIARFHELSCRWIASSRPIETDVGRYNEAFVWSPDMGYQSVRRKWYLPDAPIARETLWFTQGDRNFTSTPFGPVRLGFQLCSEMMFPEHSRELGWSGAHLIVQPRATGASKRWRVASEMSAIASGAYVISANRRSYDRNWFSGESWILSPEAVRLAETSPEQPFATVTIDPLVAEHAKQTYPRDLQRMYLRISVS